jgi:hypothetical protein
MKLMFVILVASSVLAAGCSEGPPSFSSAEELADAIGCTELETGEAERVQETGTCDFEGERLTMFVFEDAEQRDRWLTFGKRLSKDLITGPDWAVDPPDGKAAEVREALF